MSEAPCAPNPSDAGELAADLVRPALLALIGAAREGASRVAASTSDAEAVHDFRVALRRLRTHLGVVRRIWGFRLDRTRAELRFYARETGALRDEEVLIETLTDLDLSDSAAAAIGAWVARRAREAARRRHATTLLLRHGPPSPVVMGKHGKRVRLLDRSLARLAERLDLVPISLITALDLARLVIPEAITAALSYADADVTDAAAMHELRIRFKRLRYTAELFAPLAGDEASELARLAAKMQRRLGELHDLDEAMACVRRARSLEVAIRDAALLALRSAREEAAARTSVDLARVKPALIAGIVIG